MQYTTTPAKHPDSKLISLRDSRQDIYEQLVYVSLVGWGMEDGGYRMELVGCVM